MSRRETANNTRVRRVFAVFGDARCGTVNPALMLAHDVARAAFDVYGRA
jgi:hypothetical protein